MSRNQDPAAAAAYLDCTACKERLPREARQRWNCGWEERLPGHVGEYPLPLTARRPASDTCPGFLIEQPQVREVALAYMWMKEGLLREHCSGHPGRQLLDHVGLLAAAIPEAQDAAQAEEKRRREGGGG